MIHLTPRRKNQLSNDNAAQVGIGTMIVFIATVLVAAIAAGVLISTSSDLQERSSRTGQDATEQVSSNLRVESVIGKRDAASGGLDDLEIYVSLAPGAAEVDLSQVKIQISNATGLTTYSYSATATSATENTATALRDADSSFSAANPVMTPGDLVRIDVALDTAGTEFQPRDDIRVVMIPEVGNSVSTGFNTPNSYGTKTVIELV